MNEQFERTIKKLLAGILRLDATAIDEHTSSKTVESWDSLNHMKLILALEEEFDIALSEDQIIQMTAFPQLVEVVVSAKRKGRSDGNLS